MNPALSRRLGIVLLWIVFCLLAGWIFRPRYNVPEPPPRLDLRVSPSPVPDH